MSRRVIRVGGVDEPFNLPWILGFERGSFAALGIDVTFSTYAGGTGALIDGLEQRCIDLATVLTEGAVTAIGNGRHITLHSEWTDSPLRWGVHVASSSSDRKLADLAERSFAISRFGSGSELMAWVLADQQGWNFDADRLVEVGGIEGALEALPAGDADVFLWERFVTAPHVGKHKPFVRVGEISTPWPAFQIAGHPEVLESDRGLVDDVISVALNEAAAFAGDPERSIATIGERHAMNRRDCRAWLEGVSWPGEPHIDAAMLDEVATTMAELGRIDAIVAAADMAVEWSAISRRAGTGPTA